MRVADQWQERMAQMRCLAILEGCLDMPDVWAAFRERWADAFEARRTDWRFWRIIERIRQRCLAMAADDPAARAEHLANECQLLRENLQATNPGCPETERSKTASRHTGGEVGRR